jgi:hypothetical protein
MLGIKTHGGQRVKGGNYWNFTTGDRITMDGPGLLPGGRDTVYFKLPPLVLLALAPILGLAYAVFLPAIGIGMALMVIGRKLFGFVAEGFSKAAVFTWRPSEAYLAGRKQKKDRNRKTDAGKPEDQSPTGT